jgi:hypothetical protein
VYEGVRSACFGYNYCGGCVCTIKLNIGLYASAKVLFICCFSLLLIYEYM